MSQRVLWCVHIIENIHCQILIKFDAVLKMHIIKNSPLFSVAIMALVVDTVARTWIAITFLKAIQELAVLAIQAIDLLQQLMF